MTLRSIALPFERFVQLRQLAETEGQSVSDTISDFINEAIAAGRLPDELPGWNIQRIGDNVLMAHVETGFAKLLPASDAKEIGDTLSQFSQPAKGRSGYLNIDVMIEIRRQGAGVVMRDAESFISYSTAGNVAADIGRRLLMAAA